MVSIEKKRKIIYYILEIYIYIHTHTGEWDLGGIGLHKYAHTGDWDVALET